MNDLSLSRLYRRLTSARPAPAVDATDLTAALTGEPAASRNAVAAQLASSPAHADLARLLRALQSESEVLAAGVNNARRGTHAPRSRVVRHAAGAHRAAHPLRWVSGLAACLAVALGAGLWHAEQATHWNNVAASSHSVPAADRIFTSRDRIFASGDMGTHETVHHGGGDELFRGGFGS